MPRLYFMHALVWVIIGWNYVWYVIDVIKMLKCVKSKIWSNLIKFGTFNALLFYNQVIAEMNAAVAKININLSDRFTCETVTNLFIIIIEITFINFFFIHNCAFLAILVSGYCILFIKMLGLVKIFSWLANDWQSLAVCATVKHSCIHVS